MRFAILIVGSPIGAKIPEAGRFIRDFDPRDHNGRDAVPTTTDIRNAAHFLDAAAAIKFWQTQSRVRPLRPDGEPNRPLTAFTIAVVPA